MTHSPISKEALALEHLVNDAVLLLGLKIEVLDTPIKPLLRLIGEPIQKIP